MAKAKKRPTDKAELYHDGTWQVTKKEKNTYKVSGPAELSLTTSMDLYEQVYIERVSLLLREDWEALRSIPQEAIDIIYSDYKE
jgi:hypothetical protein